MKTVIRRNVFETNSSSTHSLTYTDKAPAKYTFVCDSAWSRLLMLKALVNQAEQSSKYDGSIYNEEYEEDFCEVDNEEYEVDEMINELLKEEGEDNFETFDEDCKTHVKEFFNACVKVFSKKENVPVEEIPVYLGKKLIESYKGEQLSFTEEEFLGYFLKSYNKDGDDLCSYMFSEGCLDMCDCDFTCYRSISMEVIRGKDTLEDSAEKYLYGEKKFFAKEYYAGCYAIESKIKY